jgi:hypothetical protein
MITSCELCVKLGMEELIKEEKKKKAVEIFAEEIIAPIINELTEMPKEKFIGIFEESHIYHHYFHLYSKISDWKETKTSCGNKKWVRHLEGHVEKDNPSHLPLDFNLLNQYLNHYGFNIVCKEEFYEMVKYATSSATYGSTYTSLYLSAICPEENF